MNLFVYDEAAHVVPADGAGGPDATQYRERKGAKAYDLT